MQQLRSVLVCVEGDDDAELGIERGLSLASTAGASVKVLYVTRAAPAWQGIGGYGTCIPSRRLRWQRERLAWLGMPLRGWSIPLGAQVACGPPGVAVVREVLQGGHDTVVHVERGRRRLFRATTMVQLARLCPCPLWVIRPPGSPGREHLLAAVSLDPLDSALDREILDTALAVARLLGRALHVVHAWDAPGIHLFAFRTSAADLAWYRRAVMRQHRAQLDALMSQYRFVIPRERVHLRHGLPVEVIPRLAAELAADPIVMGTAARRGIAGFLAGNTAERVVHRSERSVLIVKSPGFVSPAAPRPARARALTPAQVSVLA